MDLVSQWLNESSSDKQKAILELIDSPSEAKNDYIDLVKAPLKYGVFASDGPHFRYAIFGRDSLVVAQDLLNTNPRLVENIIFTLASLQGVANSKISEEEPGKIHHEYRCEEFGDELVPEHSLILLHNLQERWGGKGTDHVIYYGSYDATPLYVRLVGNYVKRYGPKILSKTYVRKDGKTSSIKDSVLSATDWLCAKLEASKLGFLEYKRINPLGLINQVWKDSETSYLNPDGSYPNYDFPIASVELQAYAYDALRSAKLLFHDKPLVKRWDELAKKLQIATLHHMWMPNNNFFAQAIYYDKLKRPNQITSLTSNGGLILDSHILLDLPIEQRNYYVNNIATIICSDEFITDAGIRCRAKRHSNIPSFIDYHGSYVVWPKETNEIARGLRKHGLNYAAKAVEDRLLYSVLMASEFYEFYYVEKDNTVWYNRAKAMRHFDAKSPGGNLPVPEACQAWTISGVERILNIKFRDKRVSLSAVEELITRNLKPIEIPKSTRELSKLMSNKKEAAASLLV